MMSDKWISVEDRLPEQDTPVLITQHEYVDVLKQRYFDVCVYLDGGWIDPHADSDYIEVYEPTHWMPLPEPPKED